MRSQKFKLSILLPLVGPLLLLALWELAISAKWVKPVLLPPPGDTLIFLWESLISGAINIDLLATLRRTIYAFGVATIIGVPLGIDIEAFANSVGVPVQVVSDASALTAALESAVGDGVSIIVARVMDRAEEAALLETVSIAVASALSPQ